MLSIIKEAITVEEAVEAALEELGITEEDAEITVIDEGNPGNMLGFGKRAAKVEVRSMLSAEEIAEAQEAAAEEEEPEAEEGEENEELFASDSDILEDDDFDPSQLSDEEVLELAEHYAVDYLTSIFNVIDIHGQIKSYYTDEAVFIDVTGPDLGRAIGSGGEVVNALQYLANCAVNHKFKRKVRVVLDIGNYRERNNRRLQGLAKKMAIKCQRTGRRVALPPMTPQDRREIHLFIAGFRGVKSHSEGQEPNRRVILESTNPRRGGYNNRYRKNRNNNRRY